MNKVLLLFVLLLALCTSCQKELSEESLVPYLKTDSTTLLLPEGAGGKDSFQVKSNIQWQITVLPATADWLTTSITTGKGTLRVFVSVAKDNVSDTIQEATILISPVNNITVKPISISVSQNKPAVKTRNAYGGTEMEEFFCAVATSDGGIIAVGRSTSDNGDVSGNKGQEDGWVIKIDAKGDKVWQKTLGGSDRDVVSYIVPTADGNFLIAAGGSIDGDFAGVGWIDDSKIFKIDGNGNILLKKSVPGEVYSITPATGGGYVFVGESANDFSVTKTDENLTVLWQKTYGGSGYEWASSVVEASDNGYIVAGYSDSQNGHISGNKGLGDFWIIKVDQNGNLVWEKSYGGTAYEYCYSITKAQDGGYVVVGGAVSNDGDISGHHGNSSGYVNDATDAWVIKLDVNGNKLWSKVFGGTQDDKFTYITPAQGGGFLLSGSSRSKDGDITNLKGVRDAWVVKLDENGSMIWTKNPGGNDEEWGDFILEPSKGKYVLVGTTFSSNGDVVGLNGYGDGWVLKFN
ncbi:hypothetical protein HB364_30190 [Pseudoflavitalea sp. X16]|uniref:hypothetical protein n=1 Tax=Paraflavitalea devenefica TaxID=2716334 RepID=UPI00142188FF|nr:hypothetical protein [Paraflavitalea devenefica]NII29389.1 hypothetical protein [Paraflavitalea devenefica]